VRVLVVNAGSSSLKISVLDGTDVVGSWPAFPERAPQVDAVGHRIVHGGERFRRPVVVDAEVEAQLDELTDLAPLHQPKSLRALAEARRLLPDVPHVACFDTAFHATLPREASTYALPAEWRRRYGVRKFGFHGLSHAWASRRAAEIVPGARRIVTCHLGAGASLAAVLDGACVDTTMGFTPLDGLVMATRSGSVDPGLLLWLQEREGLTEAQLAESLEHRSGLLGLAGTADMRALLDRSDDDARMALDVYLHRLVGAVASMAAATGGLDVLVFTGGVGEHAAEVRRLAAARLAFLGISIDRSLNEKAKPDADVSAVGSAARTIVVAAREDLEIARATQQLLVRSDGVARVR
jgi:acetate kinase